MVWPPMAKEDVPALSSCVRTRGTVMEKLVIPMALVAIAGPGPTQAVTGSAIVVTGTRVKSDNDASIAAVGLRRVADYAIQEVDVVGDTREPQKRRDEIFEMIPGAI